MCYTYPVIVHKSTNGGYWAEFVDFGAFSQGDTVEELISNAKEAMLCHIENELVSGATLPKPSDILQIATAGTGFTTLISAEC